MPEVEDGVLTIPQPHCLHWASCRRMRRVHCAGSGGWSTYDPPTPLLTLGFMRRVYCTGSGGWSTKDPPTPQLTLGFMSMDESGGGLCRKWRMEYSIPQPRYLHWASCQWMIQVDCAGSGGWRTYDPSTLLLTLGFMSMDGTGGLCRKWRMEYLRSLSPATYIRLHVDG